MIMQKLREFMYGRYGTDQLSLALIGGGFAFYILYVFTRSRLLYLVSLILYGIAAFRTLSKNHTKRRIENPACGQKIRIPRGRGKVEIRCPKCSHKFIKKA